MHRIGIVAKRNHQRATAAAEELARWLRARRLEAVLDPSRPEGLDLLVVLGGDGTLLAAARLVAPRGVPILGVNVGSLGFLTEVTLDELPATLERVLAGDFTVSERMMLSAQAVGAGGPGPEQAVLNDIVVTKGAVARMVELTVSVDDFAITSFRGDGLIVATPTGSTGYSLSAGGPVVHPEHRSIVLTPIAPHTLTLRPLVVPDHVTVTVALGRHEGDVILSLDGQLGVPLGPADVVRVRRAAAAVRLVHSPFRGYFEVLRTKLKWGES